MCKVVTNGYNAGATVLANSFIDRFMAEANGTYLKVYLYLLRHCQGEISLRTIADYLDITTNYVLKALKYWHSLALIDYSLNEDEELTELIIHDANMVAGGNNTMQLVKVSDTEDSDAEADIKKEVKKAKATTAAKKETKPVAEEASNEPDPVIEVLNKGTIPNWMTVDGWDELYEDEIFREKLINGSQDDIDSLAFVLNHPISPAEVDFVAFLYNKKNGCGFSSDLIIYLFRHCQNLKGKNYGDMPAYYKAVALDWYEKGLKTVADYLIPDMSAHLGAPITGVSQINRVTSWLTKYKINADVLIDACDKAAQVDSDRFKFLCGKINKYIGDKVTTMAQVKEREEKLVTASNATRGKKSSNAFNNFDQRTVTKEEDLELEKKLHNHSISKEKLDMFESRLKSTSVATRKKKAN